MTGSGIKKARYICKRCGLLRKHFKSVCPECGGYNTFLSIEAARERGVALPMGLSTGPKSNVHYMLTGIHALDEVASSGPGIVRGIGYVISGSPGSGKSTLLLQMAAHLSKRRRVGYAFIEPGGDFVHMRSHAIGIDISRVREVDADSVETLIARTIGCDIVIVDSVSELSRRCRVPLHEIAAVLTENAHETGTTWILIAHVNADDEIAGVTATEHAVDATMHLSREYGQGLRVLSGGKNRYGPERVRFLKMSEKGLVDVPDMASHLLADRVPGVPGSCVGVPLVLGHAMGDKQGAAAVLVEVQALISPVPINADTGKLVRQPHLTCDGGGIDAKRVRRILNVLQARLDIDTSDKDVTVAVCGDLEISDKGLDVPVALAIVSAVRHKGLPEKFCAWGELDLNAVIRGVTRTDDRVAEVARAGFETPVRPGTELETYVNQLLQPPIAPNVVSIDAKRSRRQAERADAKRRKVVTSDGREAAADTRNTHARRPRSVPLPPVARGVRAKGAAGGVPTRRSPRHAANPARARHRR